ncbi:hypothetical protein TB2_022553 [Malus domestica]
MFIPATPAHNNPRPFFLAARLSFERKSSSRNQFSPPHPCCSTMEGHSVWCHFHGFQPYFYIKYSPRIAPDNISRFHRTLEALFMCLLLPFLSKLWGIPFGQLPNYLKDGVACFLNMGTLSTGMREDWVAKNAKQLAPKPVDMSVGSNNLVEDGARGSDASYGGGSCSSSGKIPWGRF